ncbi:MAG: SAM-dependent methyltransferase [Opitutaceae bacterium]|nr:SAM-dependent methyltransferase [Opitutaceae bacterium]
MSSSPEPTPAASPEFLAVFRAHMDARGEMPFAQFMELALYHPEVGYYRKSRKRVGYGPGTDFFTSGTSGAVFGELVAAASAKLLRDAGRDPARHTFVEIGAEPESAGVLAGVAHPFAATRTIGIGEEIALADDCVVFSNELFDAQPFKPTVFRNGVWHEMQVRLAAGLLEESWCAQIPGAAEDPTPRPEGYRLDEPEAARGLAAAIGKQPWRGLFIAIDYGKTRRELLAHTPQGTGRAYWRHTQSNDLLARPGEQDLTCHICWDWIEGELRMRGFASLRLESQEAFFIRHAGGYIAAASAADAARDTPRKRSLQQLLHASQLGQKFQVMHGVR